jgi:predicted Zn-ribbon and HTH transcriptional regulator
MTTENNNEAIVTKLLSANEILKKKGDSMLITPPTSNLGYFLNKHKDDIELYQGKYIFIR